MFNSPFGYQRPAYHSDSSYPRQWGYPQQYRRPYVDPEEAQARARALAAQRARRAQWLPDEVDEPEDDWEYNSLPPRERVLLEAARRRQQLEQQQRQQEVARQRALEEARWQRQLEERQREEDERRRRILDEQRRIQQLKREREEALLRAMRQQSRTRSQSPQRQRSPPRSPAQEGSSTQPTPPKAPTPPPQYDERHDEAASKIQNRYRVHRSLQTIANLERQFKESQARFTFPSSIDFQRPGNDAQDHVSVPASRHPDSVASDSGDSMDVNSQTEGKLAYTSNNFSLNAYLDEMLKLLTKLDGVESWGEKAVREKRRNVVKEIEIEMARVDGYWKGVWRDYLTAQDQDRQEDGTEGQDWEKVEAPEHAEEGLRPSEPSAMTTPSLKKPAE